jgi:hypothetical protein
MHAGEYEYLSPFVPHGFYHSDEAFPLFWIIGSNRVWWHGVNMRAQINVPKKNLPEELIGDEKCADSPTVCG